MEIPNDIVGLQGLVIQLLERVEKLESENAQLKLENAQLKEENAQLKVENAELREKLKLKSHNSGKPPSSDGLAKKSLVPKPKGNNQGGQFGHSGKTLKRSENPDQIIIHHAQKCRRCEREFSVSEVEQIAASRQVFEIPEPQIEVIEHQVGVINCCGQEHYGRFPEGVEKAVQYGERIKSLAVMFNPLTVELRFGETSEVAVMVSNGTTRQNFSLERAEAERFLSKIIAAANKPEVFSKTYNMMQYFANSEWRNLDFIKGENSGGILVFSNELPTEQIEQLLPTIKDASAAEKMQELLDKGLHRRAIEIHRETTAFVKRCLSDNR